MSDKAIKETTKKDELIPEVKTFIDLRDLKAEDVKKFVKIPVAFKIAVNKKGEERVSIQIKLHDEYLKQINLAPGDDYLSRERFDLIRLAIQLPEQDPYGKPLKEWHRLVPVRFVKGKSKEGNEYKFMQLVFKQYVYDNHFFNSNQKRIIETLEAQGKLKIDWEETPELIEDFNIDALSFN